MPATDVIYYCDLDGGVPVLDWLEKVGRRDSRAVSKCAARIELLRQEGHELRRPVADYLRDEIHELRIRVGRVHYRILYFFHQENAVVLTHGLVKEGRVPTPELERAISRKNEFKRAPVQHSFREDVPNG